MKKRICNDCHNYQQRKAKKKDFKYCSECEKSCFKASTTISIGFDELLVTRLNIETFRELFRKIKEEPDTVVTPWQKNKAQLLEQYGEWLEECKKDLA